MNLAIFPSDVRTAFAPGETLTGTARWELDEPVESLELRLTWETAGKGTKDSSTVKSVFFPSPGLSGMQDFTMKLPDGPYSFSGQLITLSWALWLIPKKSKQSGKFPIVISPTGREINLLKPDGGRE
jgi:hypothetical protein